MRPHTETSWKSRASRLRSASVSISRMFRAIASIASSRYVVARLVARFVLRALLSLPFFIAFSFAAPRRRVAHVAMTSRRQQAHVGLISR